jgi:hypothetical protein
MVTAHDLTWSIHIPPDRWLPVRVTDLDTHRHVDLSPGETVHFTSDQAEVVLRTDAHEHRFGVNALRPVPAPHSPQRRGGTLRPETLLDPENGNHRVLIVSCARRFEQPGAMALSHREVAELLATNGRSEDAGVTEDAVRTRYSRAAMEIAAFLEEARVELPTSTSERRSAVADYLVSVGAVTPGILAAALSS